MGSDAMKTDLSCRHRPVRGSAVSPPPMVYPPRTTRGTPGDGVVPCWDNRSNGSVAPRPVVPRVISPLVRHLASESGVDLASARGYGAGQTLTRGSGMTPDEPHGVVTEALRWVALDSDFDENTSDVDSCAGMTLDSLDFNTFVEFVL